MKGDNPKEPIEYQVEKLRDSRTSSTRTITGFQVGEKVFHMIAAFKLPENGESHQKTAPPAISPEALSAQCVTAFLSDGFLMFNSVLPYGIPFQSHRLTSLDHSVWFHRKCPAEEWMLYDQRSIAAVDGRGLNEGEIFNSSGLLICSTKQESILRKI